MQMTNCASRFISVEDALDLELFRPNPVGFVPVDFRMAVPALQITLLAAAARTPAAHASVAAAVPGHDAAAEAAGGGVTEVDDAGERVGRVDGTRPQS